MKKKRAIVFGIAAACCAGTVLAMNEHQQHDAALHSAEKQIFNKITEQLNKQSLRLQQLSEKLEQQEQRAQLITGTAFFLGLNCTIYSLYRWLRK